MTWYSTWPTHTMMSMGLGRSVMITFQMMDNMGTYIGTYLLPCNLPPPPHSKSPINATMEMGRTMRGRRQTLPLTT